jgi:hypothetical protein
MTDLPTDTRLRAILSSWHKSRRYRPDGTGQQSRPVKASIQTELNREFKKTRYSEWHWSLITLLAFMIIDYFYLQRWG